MIISLMHSYEVRYEGDLASSICSCFVLNWRLGDINPVRVAAQSIYPFRYVPKGEN